MNSLCIKWHIYNSTQLSTQIISDKNKGQQSWISALTATLNIIATQILGTGI